MSQYLEENEIIKNRFELITEQIIILNNKLQSLEDKIDNINFNFKIIKFINKEKYNNEIDWNSVHLY